MPNYSAYLPSMGSYAESFSLLIVILLGLLVKAVLQAHPLEFSIEKTTPDEI